MINDVYLAKYVLKQAENTKHVNEQAINEVSLTVNKDV